MADLIDRLLNPNRLEEAEGLKRVFTITGELQSQDETDSVTLAVLDITHTGDFNSRFKFWQAIESAIKKVCHEHNATIDTSR